jgi:hypothetical protein
MIEDEYADICHVLTRLKNLPCRDMCSLSGHNEFHIRGPQSEIIRGTEMNPLYY